jgi:hypothetical protein
LSYFGGQSFFSLVFNRSARGQKVQKYGTKRLISVQKVCTEMGNWLVSVLRIFA